jgi:hypothetical protein
MGWSDPTSLPPEAWRSLQPRNFKIDLVFAERRDGAFGAI